MLLDSNIIIYAAQPQYPQLRELIAERSPAVSCLAFKLDDHSEQDARTPRISGAYTVHFR